jgi:hypothetical protein
MEKKPVKKKTQRKTAARHKEPRMPSWMDCVWRRVSCGKEPCPICATQGAPSEAEVPMDELWKSLEEGKEIRKNDLARLSRKMWEAGFAFEKIETKQARPPEPNAFAFYRKVLRWQQNLFGIINEAQDLGYLWPYSEASADAFWYTNVLLAKVYRQLIARTSSETKAQRQDPEYRYTQYILGECVTTIKKSLHELSYLHSDQKAELILALSRITRLEEEIMTL